MSLTWLVVQMKKGKKYQLRVEEGMFEWLKEVGSEEVRGVLWKAFKGSEGDTRAEEKVVVKEAAPKAVLVIKEPVLVQEEAIVVSRAKVFSRTESEREERRKALREAFKELGVK